MRAYEAAYVLFSLLQEGALPAEEVRRLAKRSGVATRTLVRAKELLDVRSRSTAAVAVPNGSGNCRKNIPMFKRSKNRTSLDDLSDRLFNDQTSIAPSRLGADESKHQEPVSSTTPHECGVVFLVYSRRKRFFREFFDPRRRRLSLTNWQPSL